MRMSFARTGSVNVCGLTGSGSGVLGVLSFEEEGEWGGPSCRGWLYCDMSC